MLTLILIGLGTYLPLYLLGPLLALAAKLFPIDVVADFIYESVSAVESLLLRAGVLHPV